MFRTAKPISEKNKIKIYQASIPIQKNTIENQ